MNRHTFFVLLALGTAAGCQSDKTWSTWSDEFCKYREKCGGENYASCIADAEKADESAGEFGCTLQFQRFYFCVGDTFTCSDSMPTESQPDYHGRCQEDWETFHSCYHWAGSTCAYEQRCDAADYGECIQGIEEADNKTYGPMGCSTQLHTFYKCIGDTFSCTNPAPSEWKPTYTGPCEKPWKSFYDCYSR